MKTSVIEHPPLRLIVSKSESFPEGNRAAFAAIESHLKTLQKRKFYGLVYESGGSMDYFAGLVPDSEIEERKFAALGYPVKEVRGGKCARIKLMNWTDHTDEIGPTIGAMIREHGYDPSRPQMEFYRSLRELHLLVPIPEYVG